MQLQTLHIKIHVSVLDIDDCAANPCVHGTCQDGLNKFTCTCVQGYDGPTCDHNVNDCNPSLCSNGGTCIDLVNAHMCVCAAGFTGLNCAININECLSNPCLNGATCTDGINSYTCACAAGYTGQKCHLVDSDDCQANTCENGGTCLGTPGAHVCKCGNAWAGPACTDVDDCASSPCDKGATCKDGFNAYTCQCAPGYHGDKCRAEINECLSSPCVNGGTCYDDVNKYTCTCPPGYAGTRCEIDVNECVSLPCVHGSTCHDLVNGFLCVCPTGFTGHTCQKNIDDCVPSACENGGTCLDGMNTFSCLCANGWRGKRCQNRTQTSPCASLSCRNGGQCVTSDTAAHCVCADGYTGASCEADIDTCQPDPCQNGATCTTVGHDYTCACMPGYQGKNCEIDVNECSTSPCKNGGTCVDDINKFTCTCPPGYTGPLCQIDIDECESMPCRHEGKCTDSVNKYTCTCKQGTAGPNCEHEFNVCASNPCRTGATCVPYQNTFKCLCPSGWVGDRCLYQAETNECSSNPCQNGASCHDDVNDYLCICTSGWTGKDCHVAKDECTPNPCLHSATCTDHHNNYTCTCPPGYTGRNCQKDIDDCSSNPCKNGGSCLDLVDNFQCLCTPQYTGYTCQLPRQDLIQLRLDPTHQQIKTLTDSNPPTFLDNGLPEVVRCQVNTTCQVALEVKGKSGLPPSVKPGRQSPGLRVQGIDIGERNPPVCNCSMCVYITSIHYQPTAIGTFNCCVQTLDYSGVNADELCFQIESFPAVPGNPPGMPGTSGGHFLSPPHNSTMSCAASRPCSFIIETHKQSGQACADLHDTGDGGRVQVIKMAPDGQVGTCKYEVAFTPPSSQTGQHTICVQSETNPDDTLCTKVNVKSSSEIETSMSQCSAVHCEHGFCDSSNSPATCRCRPGYHGTLCKIASNCSIGSIPKSVKCTKGEECSVRFIITGSVDVPAVTPIGDVLTVKVTPDNNDVFTYYTTVHVLRPANTPRVCLNITVADRNRLGKCATSTCIQISYSQVSTSAPNSFPSAPPVFDCKAGTDECPPVLLTSQPDPDGSCPLLSVHPESTVENVHLSDSQAVDGRCLTTAVFRPGSGGGHEQLCVTTGSDVACLATDGGNEPCTSGQPTKVREKARKRVKEGYVSCKCLVDDKEVDIIQKKPVPQPRHMVKAASFGAGGMAGTMVVGVIMYLIISRFRKPPDADDLVGMPSVRQVSVRPGSSKPPLSPSPKFARASSPPHRIHPLLRRQQDNLRPMPKSMDF
ncbi:fibropellin-1-like [Mya arenaria]|uniref:fibropellin-1-like n=1 Tax=Mya arenaria TaxID=6604 RepID=UPI0022E223BE|nr:fibropellin-1-like [Mya arenaria]